MSRICEFFGVVIYMYYNDHRPPHFHAAYAEHEALFVIDTLKSSTGSCHGGPGHLWSSGRHSIEQNFVLTGRKQDKACPSNQPIESLD
jgi:hypothetical protein